MKYERPKELRLQWKECSVDLGLALAEIQSRCSKIIGYTGTKDMILFYREDLSQGDKDNIREYWDSLSPEHDHCKDYKSFSERKAHSASRDDKVKQAKLAMVAKTWANMSAAERKLCMGLDEEVSDSELQSLLE